MTPVLLLEDYFLTRLHMDWAWRTSERVDVKATQSSFDYVVANHVNDPHRRMLTFRAKFQELDAKDQKVGHTIEVEIVGLLATTEATPKGKEELIARLNGVSLLYGILRGVLATTTGAFPGRRFSLPSIMPQDIVDEVEARRAEEAKQTELGKGRRERQRKAETK